MATRRIGAARFDHGAQFFTIRSDAFAARIQPHIDSGLVYEWCRGFPKADGAHGDGYPRYAVRGGMNALAKAMAAPLDVRCNSFVFAIRPNVEAAGRGGAWSIALDDGSALTADAVVVTCPVPQSYSLLVAGGLTLPEALIRADYDRTIAVMLSLSAPAAVPEPGGTPDPGGVLSFVTDNQRKGVSDTPAVTVHAKAGWSEAHWGDDPAALVDALSAEAARYLGGAAVIEAQVKRWRFATPRTVWPDPCWTAAGAAGPLALAGDAFAGPKVEGAVQSGAAAAALLLV